MSLGSKWEQMEEGASMCDQINLKLGETETFAGMFIFLMADT